MLLFFAFRSYLQVYWSSISSRLALFLLLMLIHDFLSFIRYYFWREELWTLRMSFPVAGIILSVFRLMHDLFQVYFNQVACSLGLLWGVLWLIGQGDLKKDRKINGLGPGALPHYHPSFSVSLFCKLRSSADWYRAFSHVSLDENVELVHQNPNRTLIELVFCSESQFKAIDFDSIRSFCD